MPICVFQRSATKSGCWKIVHTVGFAKKKQSVETEINRLSTIYYEGKSQIKILSQPEVQYRELPDRNESLSEEEIQQIEITVKYAGYIDRQELEVKKFKKMEDKLIPSFFDYSNVPSLRLEARQKLGKIRPASIGQAARISGVSPADISIILVWLKRAASHSEGIEKQQEKPDGA